MYYTIQDPTYKEYTVYVVCTLTVYTCVDETNSSRDRGEKGCTQSLILFEIFIRLQTITIYREVDRVGP